MADGGDNLKDRRTAHRPQRVEPPAARQRQPQLQPGQGLASPIPELTYTLQGVEVEIGTIVWHGGNVQHCLAASDDYITSLDLESKPPEDLVYALYEDMPGVYSDVIAHYRSKEDGEGRNRHRRQPGEAQAPAAPVCEQGECEAGGGEGVLEAAAEQSL